MALPKLTKGQQEKAVCAVGERRFCPPSVRPLFCFPSGPTPSGKDVADHEKTYVLIQAPYTVIYAVIFPYVWPPTKWQQSAHAPPMTGEGKHGILVV